MLAVCPAECSLILNTYDLNSRNSISYFTVLSLVIFNTWNRCHVRLILISFSSRKMDKRQKDNRYEGLLGWGGYEVKFRGRLGHTLTEVSGWKEAMVIDTFSLSSGVTTLLLKGIGCGPRHLSQSLG